MAARSTSISDVRNVQRVHTDCLLSLKYTLIVCLDDLQIRFLKCHSESLACLCSPSPPPSLSHEGCQVGRSWSMPLWSLSFNNRWCLFSVIFRILHTDNIARSLVLLIIDDEDDEADVHAFTWRRLHSSHTNKIHYIGYTVNRSSTQNISCRSTMKTNNSVTLPSTAVPMIFNR